MMKKVIDEKNLDEYINLFPEMAFVKDQNGRYIYCNLQYANFIGKPLEEVLNKTDYDLLDKENADQCFKNDQDVLNGYQAIEFDELFKFPDKGDIYIKTTKQVIYDKKEKIIGIISIVRDITEIKQYQLIYEENNELLEYMNFETNTKEILTRIVKLAEKRDKNIKCSILLLDESKDHLRNGASPSLPSFYRDAIDGIGIGEKIGSCGSAAFSKKRIIVENIDTHINWQPYLELTQRANLHSCWSEPMFSSNNEILGTFAMYSNTPSSPTPFQLKLISSYARLASLTIEKENKKINADIKIRQTLERKLAKRTKDLELFKKVIENVNYGVMITTADKSHRLMYVNKAFEKITGYAKREVLGKNCKFLQNKDNQQKGIGILKKAIRSEEKVQVELRNYKKDNTLFYNYISISPVYDENNNLTNFVGIQKDITQDKQQEARITEQSKLASMGEMIANIAHQWRQPLSVISTAATGMQLQKEFGLLQDNDFNKTCTAINENVQYLSQTIDDFKNFIKNDSPKKYFNLSKIINKFLSLVTGTMKSNEIEVILNTDNTIQIDGYENELIQCFMNIFNNAKDAFDPRQKKLIFIDSYIQNNKVAIHFKDNAGGIPEEFLSKIFEPYFTTKHKFQGTGLGLHMTYNLIDDGMNGNIDVTNSLYSYDNINYKGADFMIILPFK